MLDRTLSALVALSLAFLVWLYARSRDQETLDNVPLPVQVTLDRTQMEQYCLEVPEPCQVPASFTGPPARIRELRGLLQRGELRVGVVLRVPDEHQEDSRYTETIRIDAADVHAPRGVTPLIVEGRNRLLVTLYRMAERRLPVLVDVSGNDRVGQVSAEPATVLVRGPEELLDRTRALPTQPYFLPPTAAGGKMALGPVPLVQELEGRSIRVTPSRVAVQVSLLPRKQVYEVEAPVYFLCPANFELRPRFPSDTHEGRVHLSVEGPPGQEPAATAFVDLTRHPFEQGLHSEPLRIQLPKDCQVAPGTPRRVTFQLDALESAAEEESVVPHP